MSAAWSRALKSPGAPGPGVAPGYRVWKVRVPRAQRTQLRELYYTLVWHVCNSGLPSAKQLASKGALRYGDEWRACFTAVRASRGKWLREGEPPALPPLILPTHFVLSSGERRGRKQSPVKVDLRKKQIGILGVLIPLRDKLVKKLEAENLLNPRPEFVTQLTYRGELRVIAKRALAPPTIERADLLIITIDENSRHGFSVAAWLLDLANARAALAHFEKLRPPNHGLRRQIAALLESFADKPTSEVRAALAQLLPEGVVKALTPERARELAAKLRRRERRLNNSFVEKTVSKIRKIIRKYGKGKSTLIIVEPIDAESVRGTPLQGTLLRARRALENLAKYEGALYTETRASGKRCSRCGCEGEEVARTGRARIYRCPRCGLKWDRDKGVHYSMVKRFFERMLGEECDDLTVLAERALSALKEWLGRHPNILTY